MSRLYRPGLVVLGITSLADLAGPLLTDGQHPPMSIALAGAAMGLVGIVLLILAWRGRRPAAVGLVVVRMLSALTAVPAFLGGGVPAPAMILAGTFIVLTLVGAVFVLSGMRRQVLASA